MTMTSGRVGSVKVLDATTTTAYTTPAITCSAVIANKAYRVPTAQGDKQFIDPSQAMTVKVDSVVKTYGVDYVVKGGVIIFLTTITVTTGVTIESYNYFTTKALADVKEYSLDITYDVENTNYINDASADAGWQQKCCSFAGAEVSVSKYFTSTVDQEFLTDHLTATFVIELFIDTAANKRYRCYALLNQDSVKNVANGVIEADLKFESVGNVFYISG